MTIKAHLDPAAPSGDGIDDRRAERRELWLETSGVLPSGLAANVVVHNISAAGLLLETDLPLERGETLIMHLPQTGPVTAVIVWRSDDLYGCAFERALGETALTALHSERRRDNFTAGSTGESGLPPEPLGMRLNRLRRERGMTLAQVAAALDVSKPTVWAWEKSKARPLPERIAAIAEILGVDEDDLDDDPKYPENTALVEDCRSRIAAAYGTHPSRVRILIEV
jgi:transcriptional regulator with XRE-family HTH domain